jgi:4-amino-4-deoxy-L-arabinose transferase-like glycosyltransferase
VSERAPSDARAFWIYGGLAVFVAIMWFATLSSRPLFNPDEGRYAEIPREMLSGGDWVIPHLNGLAYIEKPPLQYWATALSLRVFGPSEFGARFYTAFCALGTLAVVWWVAKALWDTAAAWRASAVLSGLLLFVILGQLLTLDMSLTLYMTLSLAGFLLAQPRGDPSQGRLMSGGQRRWMLLAWVAAGAGVLTKGLVAAAIPAAVLVIYSLCWRNFSPWRRLYASVGLPLFLVITVPWHWLAARRMPDFLQFFFVHEHLSRYLTPSADREEAWWFFGAVFVLGSLPWTLSAIRVVLLGWRRPASRGQFNPLLFLWVWVVFVCVFFSLSDSKLIPYILPAMPALALAVAALPVDILRRDVFFTALLTLVTAIAVAAASALAPRFVAPTARNEHFLMLAKPLVLIAALLAVSGIFVLLQRRRDVTRAVVFLSVGWCLAGLLLMRAAAAVAPIYSGLMLAKALSAIPSDAPIYSVGTYDQTLAFYGRRTVTLVAYRGELDFGLQHDPAADIPSVAEFLDRWQNVPSGYVVMETSMFDDLKSHGVPLREMARGVRRVLAARR